MHGRDASDRLLPPTLRTRAPASRLLRSSSGFRPTRSGPRASRQEAASAGLPSGAREVVPHAPGRTAEPLTPRRLAQQEPHLRTASADLGQGRFPRALREESPDSATQDAFPRRVPTRAFTDTHSFATAGSDRSVASLVVSRPSARPPSLRSARAGRASLGHDASHRLLQHDTTRGHTPERPDPADGDETRRPLPSLSTMTASGDCGASRALHRGGRSLRGPPCGGEGPRGPVSSEPRPRAEARRPPARLSPGTRCRPLARKRGWRPHSLVSRPRSRSDAAPRRATLSRRPGCLPYPGNQAEFEDCSARFGPTDPRPRGAPKGPRRGESAPLDPPRARLDLDGGDAPGQLGPPTQRRAFTLPPLGARRPNVHHLEVFLGSGAISLVVRRPAFALSAPGRICLPRQRLIRLAPQSTQRLRFPAASLHRSHSVVPDY
jgi:hypothetical protein